MIFFYYTVVLKWENKGSETIKENKVSIQRFWLELHKNQNQKDLIINGGENILVFSIKMHEVIAQYF